MKTRSILAGLLLAFFLAVPGRAAEHDIEFTGVLVLTGKTMIVLTDKKTETSRWVSLGAEYNGYAVSSYDPKADVVVLTRGGKQFRLPLKSARVKDAPSVFAAMTIEARRSLWQRVKDLDGAAFLKAMAEESDLPDSIARSITNLRQVQEHLNTEPNKLEGNRTKIAESQKKYDSSVAAGDEPRVQQQNLARLKADQAFYNATLKELDEFAKLLSDGVLNLKLALSASF